MKKMKHKILLLTLFASLGVTHVNAQLRKWVLPYQNTDPNQTVVPIIDFTNGSAEFSTSPLTNYYSSQTVGNGDYCNNCPDKSRISELIITGKHLDRYNGHSTTSDWFGALMASYEPIGQCNIIQDVLKTPLAPEFIEGADRNYEVDDIVSRNGKHYKVIVPGWANHSPADGAWAPGTGTNWQQAWQEVGRDDLAHESLNEIAMSDGEANGEFLVLMQKSLRNYQAPMSGQGLYLQLLDAHLTDQNNVIDLHAIGNALDASENYPSSNGFCEGVAIGPRFTHSGIGNPSLSGKRLRSLYAMNNHNGSGYIVHFYVDLDQLDNLDQAIIYEGSKETNGIRQTMELELSFPVPEGENHSTHHPKFLGTTGWKGVYLYQLDENGAFGSDSEEHTLSSNKGAYGLEFSQNGDYVYYNTMIKDFATKVFRVSLIPLEEGGTGTLTAGKEIFQSDGNRLNDLDGVAWQQLSLESAIDGNIYGLNKAGDLYRISDPNSPVKRTIERIADASDFSANFNETLGLSLPDWVDGEEPLSTSMTTLNLCVDRCDDNSETIEVHYEGKLFNIYTIENNECREIKLCPGDYELIRHGFDDPISFTLESGDERTEEFKFDDCPVPCAEAMGIDLKSEDVTHYAFNTTINQNTIWDNKVYISKDVILTVDGVTLDITTADVIFDDCAGIDFINGGNIRASNSVFRPCDDSRVWRGLKFDATIEPSTLGILNECTFKNASKAVVVQASGSFQNANLRFTNNLFSNCQNGIRLTNVTLNRAISGNTFQTDNDHPDFSVQCGNTNAIDGFIIANKCDLAAEITQNDFVDATTNSSYIGMRLIEVQAASISQNKFINNRVSINGFFNSNIKIEDNEFSVTGNVWNGPGQIYFGESNNTMIKNNEFYNLDLNNESSGNGVDKKSAIHVLNQDVLNIKENEIKGFNHGIIAKNIENSNISENTLHDNWHYGIYVENPSNVDVSCNYINMELVPNRPSFGVALFYSNFFQGTNSIRGNCIYETTTAIHSEDLSTTFGSTAPVITNNFLYNYIQRGVALVNLDASNSMLPTPRNSFIGNTAGNYLDIFYSGNPIWVGPSFGISKASPEVNLAPGLESSIASCGGQIDDSPSNQVGVTEHQICDRLEGNEHLYPPQPRSFDSNMNFDLVEPSLPRGNEEVRLITQDMFEMYPNPALDFVDLKINSSTSDFTTIEVYSIDGRLVKVQENTGRNLNVKLDVSNLQSGVFVVKLVDEINVIGQSKLVVKK